MEDNLGKLPLQTQVGGNHYKDFKIQPVEFCMVNNLNFCQSSVVKYVCRYKNKNGKQDIDKAIHFLQILKQIEYPEPEPDYVDPVRTLDVLWDGNYNVYLEDIRGLKMENILGGIRLTLYGLTVPVGSIVTISDGVVLNINQPKIKNHEEDSIKESIGEIAR